MVGPDGEPPLPWLREPLLDTLARARGHALLVQGAAGIGTLEFALSLAQSWLCERRAGPTALPCGRCDGCRAIQGQSHPDLFVLQPEVMRQGSGWTLPGDRPEEPAAAEGAKARRKPSRQVRIDEVRSAIDWAASTASRGGAKVIVLHPAEALNVQAANALLKTLEEPPQAVRLVLCAQDPDWLLPTIRSRCQAVRLPPPTTAQALAWLKVQGLPDPEVLLTGTGGHPLQALAWARAGIDARAWSALPHAVSRGQAAALGGWPLPQALDALHRLCHDALRVAAGGQALFFPGGTVPRGELQALGDWQRELVRVTRHDGHPWNEGLLMESLVEQGRRAMTSGTPKPRSSQGA